MSAHDRARRGAGLLLTAIALTTGLTAHAGAVPSFFSSDRRLPNPDQPYLMVDRSPEYGAFVFVDDLEIRITDPSQLDTPMPNMDGDWEFDSTFDIHYSAILSVGLAPPMHISGVGSARAAGVAPGGGLIFEPRVYDVELLTLDLIRPSGSTPYPQFWFRESPTLESRGVTTTEDPCPVCASPLFALRISSFFDVFAEVSLDGGATWSPGSSSFRIVQTPEPAAMWLLLVGVLILGTRRWRCTREMTPGRAGG